MNNKHNIINATQTIIHQQQTQRSSSSEQNSAARANSAENCRCRRSNLQSSVNNRKEACV
jgi:hypothetical protein